MNFKINANYVKYVTMFGFDYFGSLVAKMDYLPDDMKEKVINTLNKDATIERAEGWLDIDGNDQVRATISFNGKTYKLDTDKVPCLVEIVDGKEVAIDPLTLDNTVGESKVTEDTNYEEEQRMVDEHENAIEPEVVDEPKIEEDNTSSDEQKVEDESKVKRDTIQIPAGIKQPIEVERAVKSLEDEEIHKISSTRYIKTQEIKSANVDMSLIAAPRLISPRRSRARVVATEEIDQVRSLESVKPAEEVVYTEPEEVKVEELAPTTANEYKSKVVYESEHVTIEEPIMVEDDSGKRLIDRIEEEDTKIKEEYIGKELRSVPMSVSGDIDTEFEEVDLKNFSAVSEQDLSSEAATVPTEEELEEVQADVEQAEQDIQDVEDYSWINRKYLKKTNSFSLSRVVMDARTDEMCVSENWENIDGLVYVIDDVSRLLRCIHSDALNYNVEVPYTVVEE